MNRKSEKRMMAFCAAVGAALGVAAADDEDVCAALEALLATRYCGTSALEAGVGLHTAIRGESPVYGGGIFDVPETKWLPVLLDMAEKELALRKRDLADAVTETRRWEALGEKRDNSDDEGTRRLWACHERISAGTERLRSMVACLRHATGGTKPVLDFVERVAKECPPEFDLAVTVNGAMVAKACQDGEPERCPALARWYRGQFGAGCPQEWDLAHKFARSGIPKLETPKARTVGIRYLLEFADTLKDPELAQGLDSAVLEAIPGWVGSLQRRRMAERCFSAAARDGDSSAIPKSASDICPWAAVELAAEEGGLADLREVYGDWGKEKGEE